MLSPAKTESITDYITKTKASGVESSNLPGWVDLYDRNIVSYTCVLVKKVMGVSSLPPML